jgi:peroxiredoxin Q/BCP
MLSWIAKPLTVGSTAPPFMAPDQDGSIFILNQHRNKYVILVFYPGDDTLVCTKQLCELRDRWDRIQAAGGYVLGINPADDASHTSFRKKHGLPFPLLVDYGKRVAKLYHCDGPIVRRTVYVVDKEGKIAYARRGKPSVDEILQVLPAQTTKPAD